MFQLPTDSAATMWINGQLTLSLFINSTAAWDPPTHHNWAAIKLLISWYI